MEELFKAFDELNVNKTCTMTIMYDKYLEWSITVIDEGTGQPALPVINSGTLNH